MSIREQGSPEFSQSLRGYDRAQVDEYVGEVRAYAIQVEDRAAAAESALAQCRRELATSPGNAGISQRLAAILQLANEEADEIRALARAEAEATTQQAADEAARTVNEANQHRDAIQREIDDLTVVRAALLERLAELGNGIRDATDRYEGYAPGTAPIAHAEVELFDGEAIEDEPPAATEQAVDPEAETQILASPGNPPPGDA